MFKKGDEIVCTKEEEFTWIEIGEKMIVLEVLPIEKLKPNDNWDIRVCSKDGIKERWCDSNNFKIFKD